MVPRISAALTAGALVTLTLFGVMPLMIEEDARPSLGPTGVDLPPVFDPPREAKLEPPPTHKVPDKPKAKPSRDESRDDPPPSVVLDPTPVGIDSTTVIPFVKGPVLDRHTDGPVGIGTETLGPIGGGCYDGEPQPRLMVEPQYPRQPRIDGIEGQVELELTVSPEGRVVDARILSAKPRGVFDSASLRAVKRWTFEPAQAGCGATAAVVRETLEFRIEGEERF